MAERVVVRPAEFGAGGAVVARVALDADAVRDLRVGPFERQRMPIGRRIQNARVIGSFDFPVFACGKKKLK